MRVEAASANAEAANARALDLRTFADKTHEARRIVEKESRKKGRAEATTTRYNHVLEDQAVSRRETRDIRHDAAMLENKRLEIKIDRLVADLAIVGAQSAAVAHAYKSECASECHIHDNVYDNKQSESD